MKKLYTFSAILFSVSAFAQSTFWTEDFGNGCNRARLASAYTGTNGAWTIMSTGTNDTYANPWFVSAAASGTGAGNCSSSCVTASSQNEALHIGNPAVVIPSIISIGADTGSTYLTGTFSAWGINSTTNNRVQSPIINCTGQSNITIAFVYYEGGQGTTDDATLVYSSDGGTTWNNINAMAQTANSCTAPAGTWTTFSATLPAACNNNSMVKIGFNWTNNNDGNGNDPSFAVDDITLTSNPTGIAVINPEDIGIFVSGANQITVNTNGMTWQLLGITDMLGRTVDATKSESDKIQFGELAAGVYVVNLNVNGQRITKKVAVN